MNTFLPSTAVILFLFLLLFPIPCTAADFIIKYYIYGMKTEADQDKVVNFIKEHDGVAKVETVLDRHWVYVYLDDEVLDDERFDVRVPLREIGYPVARWEVLLEKPESHE